MNLPKGRTRVPARRVSMRKLREVMHLRFELHLGYQQIGRSCAIGVSTVCKYLKRAEAAGVTWPLPEGWDAKEELRAELASVFILKGGPCVFSIRRRRCARSRKHSYSAK